jgi:hypothetical protein
MGQRGAETRIASELLEDESGEQGLTVHEQIFEDSDANQRQLRVVGLRDELEAEPPGSARRLHAEI